MKYKVGDIIVSASSDSYVGEIIHISKEEDVVRHRCRKTGTEYEKSYFGFQCRYMSVEERLEKDKEFCAENIQLHQQILTMEREHNDALATSKERRESLAHVAAERDEARWITTMTKDEFMRRANNLSLLQGEVDALFGELERLRERIATQEDGLRHGEQVCARLVAERDEACQKEREGCARICDLEFAANWHSAAMAAANAAKRCAELIRKQEKP